MKIEYNEAVTARGVLESRKGSESIRWIRVLFSRTVAGNFAHFLHTCWAWPLPENESLDLYSPQILQ